jgi:hypothetical protein
MLKLEKMPSPTGRNAEHLYILRVPPRGMAYDSKDGLMPGQTELSPWEKVIALAREGGLDGEKMSIFEQALASLCKHAAAGTAQADVDPDGDPETALDDTEEVFEHGPPTGVEPKEGSRVDRYRDVPEWASDPEQRALHWKALDKFVRAKGASDSDVAELREQWTQRYGGLPKTALNGRLGGELASDAKRRARARRQVAFDRRYPEAGRLEPRSALEVSYGVEPRTAYRETSQATLDRWPQAARIGVA